MKFRICTILIGMYAVYFLDGEIVDREAARFMRAVLNPRVVPRVAGVRYFYSLDDLQKDVIIPVSIEGPAIGLNSDVAEFTALNADSFRDQLVKAIGLRTPLYRRYLQQLSDASIEQYLSFCQQKAVEVGEYSDFQHASIEELLFGSPTSADGRVS